MKSTGMTFERARGLIKGCLFGAVGFCVVGLIINSTSPDLAMYAVVAAVIFIVFSLFLVATCMKCPYCGQRIIRNCLVTKSCPHCRRDLVSGIKTKGKKGR